MPQLLWRELRLDSAGDCPGHLTLQHQNPAQFPLVVFGPQMLVGRSVNELHGNAHLFPLASHSPFNHSIHAQFAGNLRQGFPCATLVMHHRSTRDDLKSTDLGKLGDQRFGHAIREILLLWVTGEVFQGQNRERLNPGRAHAAEQKVAPTAEV